MDIFALLLSFALLLIAMTIHEFAHGWVAYRLGDSTAKYSGRLTLNPLAHIDPIGTVLLPLLLFISTGGRFVFGYAKAVPINYWGLKNPRRDMGLIGLSGPLANLIFAFLLSIISAFFDPASAIKSILEYLVLINVVLGVFNLIPIPPMDGSRILIAVLPEKLAAKYMLIEPYGFMIIILLIFFRVVNLVIWPMVNRILSLYSNISAYLIR